MNNIKRKSSGLQNSSNMHGTACYQSQTKKSLQRTDIANLSGLDEPIHYSSSGCCYFVSLSGTHIVPNYFKKSRQGKNYNSDMFKIHKQIDSKMGEQNFTGLHLSETTEKGIDPNRKTCQTTSKPPTQQIETATNQKHGAYSYCFSIPYSSGIKSKAPKSFRAKIIAKSLMQGVPRLKTIVEGVEEPDVEDNDLKAQTVLSKQIKLLYSSPTLLSKDKSITDKNEHVTKKQEHFATFYNKIIRNSELDIQENPLSRHLILDTNVVPLKNTTFQNNIEVLNDAEIFGTKVTFDKGTQCDRVIDHYNKATSVSKTFLQQPVYCDRCSKEIYADLGKYHKAQIIYQNNLLQPQCSYFDQSANKIYASTLNKSSGLRFSQKSNLHTPLLQNNNKIQGIASTSTASIFKNKNYKIYKEDQINTNNFSKGSCSKTCPCEAFAITVRDKRGNNITFLPIKTRALGNILASNTFPSNPKKTQCASSEPKVAPPTKRITRRTMPYNHL